MTWVSVLLTLYKKLVHPRIAKDTWYYNEIGENLSPTRHLPKPVQIRSYQKTERNSYFTFPETRVKSNTRPQDYTII